MKLELQNKIIQDCLTAHRSGIPLVLGKLGDFDKWNDALKVEGSVHPFFAPLLGKPVRRYLTAVGSKKDKNKKMIPSITYFETARVEYGLDNEQALAFIVGANAGKALPFYEKEKEYYQYHLAGIRVARVLKERRALYQAEEPAHFVEYAMLIMAMYLCIYIIFSLN